MEYYVKQKFWSLKSEYAVQNEEGEILYRVKANKVLSLKNELELTNPNGAIVLKASKKRWSFLDKYTICNAADNVVATADQQWSWNSKFKVEVGGRMLDVDGSLMEHKFTITTPGKAPVAAISKKILSWGDTYKIEIFDKKEKNPEIFMFLIVIIDQVVHEGYSYYAYYP